MLKEGLKGSNETISTKEKTAAAMGSGSLQVYGTPMMIVLMEETCFNCAQAQLEEGSTTVGISVNIKHLAATPVGMKVTCESELIKVEGRALTFHVKAFDESGLIGEGEHERFIVMRDKFQEKTDAKLKK